MFSVVKDKSSEIPDVWKAVVVWTTHKPETAYKIKEWESTVSRLYTNAISIWNIVTGHVDALCKNIYVERKILNSMYRKIKNDLAREVKHNYFYDDLDELLEFDSHAEYMEPIYGSVAGYIDYHNEILKVSDDGNVVPRVDSGNFTLLNKYLQVTLPNKIREEANQERDDVNLLEGIYENEEEKEDLEEVGFKPEDELGSNFHPQNDKRMYLEKEENLTNLEKVDCNRVEELERNDNLQNDQYIYLQNEEEQILYEQNNESEAKIFQLEKESIVYLHSQLKQVHEQYGYVCCLFSRALENLLISAPELIQIYLSQKHTTLTGFIQCHKSVFSIGEAGTIIAAARTTLEQYLSDGLQRLIPNDVCSTQLYQEFLKQHNVSSSTLRVSAKASSLEDVTKLTLSPSSDEIYYSDDNDDNGFQAKKVLEILTTSKTDACTQTLSTGPVMSILQFTE